MADPMDSDYHGNVEQPGSKASFAASGGSPAPSKFSSRPDLVAARLRTAANFIENGWLKEAYIEARCASDGLLDFILEAQKNSVLGDSK